MEWNKLSPHLRHLSHKDQERVQAAHALGMKWHEGQKRKSGEPYFTHPVAVTMMLADMGADPDTLIASLLHDTVEDTDLTLNEIDTQFNGSVRALIDGVTKLEAEDIADRPTLNEQTETLRKIFTLMKEDVRIMVIKLVDRLHNMQTVRHLSQEKQVALAKETTDVYVKIAERLSMQDLSDQLEHLCIAVLEPDTAKELEKLRVENERRGHGVMQSMKLALQQTTPEHLEMRYEVKTWEKLREQMIAEHVAVTGLSNVTVAFLAHDEEACYRILGLLHRLWRRETLSFQDFINSPAINGYKGLHTTVILEDGTRVRCKIRTKEMHEYARRGIAALCFDSKASGVEEYLPWTARIGPLTKDMADRSREFWESLQSDILGESIVVHGAGDLAISLPEGSTALDGVFYCFHEKALRTEAIKVDGKEVPFSAPLRHGVSLNITLAKRFTVQREWLRWVNTGVAAAKIREALAMQSERKKYVMGKDALQKLMIEKQKGYIEEFDRKKLAAKMHTIGYSSIDEAYTAIADGRLSAEEVFTAIFKDMREHDDFSKTTYRFRFTVEEKDIPLMTTGLADIYKKFSTQMKHLRVVHEASTGDALIYMVLSLTQEERDSILKEYGSLGIHNIESVSLPYRQFALLSCVIFLWALNPVIAKWFLVHDIAPLTLVTIRLLSFGIFSMLLFGVWVLITKKKYTSVSRISLFAVPPAIALIGMTVFNYLALAQNIPSIHLTILRLSVFLLPIIACLHKKRAFKPSSIFLMLAFLAFSITLLAALPSSPPRSAIFLSSLALLSYTAYSLISEYVLSQNKINVRYPLFLFYLGVPLGIAGLLMIPFQPLQSITSPLILPMVGYVLLFVFIPHICYALLLRTMKFRFLSDALTLEVPIALAFESLLLGITLAPSMYVALAVIILLLFVYRRIDTHWMGG